MTNLDLHISRVGTSGGESISLNSGETLVVVGPNNAGKSLFIREIYISLGGQSNDQKVASELDVHKSGSTDDFMNWVRQTHFVQGDDVQGTVIVRGTHIGASTARAWWDTHAGVAVDPSIVALMADASARLGMGTQSSGYVPHSGPVTHPVDKVYDEPALEELLSDISMEAFGAGIVVNRFGGSQIDLRFGDPAQVPEFTFSKEYSDAIRAMPTVDEQGDGVKSFLGLMTVLVSAAFPVIFIDEPEAFLHPPVARTLGRKIAEFEDSQKFVATHDADILRGLIDSPGNVTVARLTRDGEVNHASVLSPRDLRDLWEDPVLRYSGILNGVFHSGAVICEGDGDCRFYEAALDHHLAAEKKPNLDLLFAHGNGKGRIPKLVNALRAVDVPVSVIADLDLLRNEQDIQAVVESLGASWNPLEADWKIVSNAIKGVADESVTVESAQERIISVLEACEDTYLDKATAKEIQRTIKFRDGWSKVKEHGLRGVPKGPATTAAESLIANLQTIGVFLVPVGELEGWDRSIGSKGPGWVPAALANGSHAAREPQELAREVAEAF